MPRYPSQAPLRDDATRYHTASQRQASPGAASFHRTSLAAMRFLHTGIFDVGGQFTRAESGYQRCGHSGRAILQSLSLHRVQEYRCGSEGSSRCGRRGWCCIEMDTALSLNPSPDTSLRTACIGKSVTRLEDAPLVRGEGCFAADVSFPHQLYMRVVRSQVAHGSIVAIDTSGAAALPGVVAVWTSADVAEVPPIPYRPTKLTGLDPYCQPILARDRVRYVGEP